MPCVCVTATESTAIDGRRTTVNSRSCWPLWPTQPGSSAATGRYCQHSTQHQDHHHHDAHSPLSRSFCPENHFLDSDGDSDANRTPETGEFGAFITTYSAALTCTRKPTPTTPQFIINRGRREGELGQY